MIVGGEKAKVSAKELAKLRSVHASVNASAEQLQQTEVDETVTPIKVVAYSSPDFITYSFEQLKTG